MPVGAMTVIRNALAGLKWALIMATLLSLWVVFLALLQGSSVFRTRSESISLSLQAIVAVYYGGAVIVGLVAGALRPALVWKTAAFVIGAAVSIPIGAGLYVTRIGFDGWTRLESFAVIAFSLAFGGPGGLILREFSLNASRRVNREGPKQQRREI